MKLRPTLRSIDWRNAVGIEAAMWRGYFWHWCWPNHVT